jgi:hypothetical protein
MKKIKVDIKGFNSPKTLYDYLNDARWAQKKSAYDRANKQKTIDIDYEEVKPNELPVTGEK